MRDRVPYRTKPKIANAKYQWISVVLYGKFRAKIKTIFSFSRFTRLVESAPTRIDGVG
jgi:hypothetical protein